ncbi:AfsR/SARP family transcriptional regulator [Amycolatopsis anabasis]|uniref:AfsR/SARP family transcriptional regulator n=1 Tax=Amycolatopsis anabasis TaxID=1840409 RepID=UPI00131C0A9F|nr:BTAD domain-containing putative transcriptional regulator [Amycolatopsis anabasis]
MAVEFRLLGGVEAKVDGRPVDLGHARRQCVLVALLVEANHAVSVEQLIDRVWAEDPPNRARNALHGYLGKLRGALAGAPGVAINRSPGGYVLTADEQSVDLHRFRHLLAQARAAEDDRALALYQQALDLWQGEAFAGLDSTWVATVRSALDQERLAAELDHTDVRLRLGQHAELLPALSAQAERRPLDERLAGQLLLALYRAGRQAEALAHYERTRLRLAEELGADPSPPLRELHQRILRSDQTLAHAPATEPPPRNDLPGDVADFTGRESEIRRLFAAVADADRTGVTVAISAIDGMAGVGKTALALRVAHHLADRYPDGQLFLDLHGHAEGRQPVAPATALAGLLRAVGVPIEEIPDSVAERASRWRAELAKRKVLVVLDNAADAAQVRPLLPGAAGSLTLITSRRRLPELDTTCSLSLELLPPDDAVELFTRVAGPRRAAAEPGAVAEVARLCGYLPLALRIAAARLRTRPAWSVAHLADRLGDEQRRLAELSAGDRSVAAAFALSYQHLAPERQRLFRLLGLVPGPHWDAYLAAALTGAPVADAEDGLEQLLDVHLLTQPAAGRYQLHDLLAEHAHAVALQEEPAESRNAAVDRMLRYYRTAGARAVETGFPVPGLTDRFESATATTDLPEFTGDRSLTWLRTERPNLAAAHRLVPDTSGTLPLRLDLLALLSFAQCFGGQGVEGIDTTRQLLALIPPGDDLRRMTAIKLCATVERLLGSPGTAKSLLLGELSRLPQQRAAEAAPLYLRLVVEHLSTGEVAEADPLLDVLDAMELGTTVRFIVAVFRAMAAYLSGDIPATLSRLDSADRLIREPNPATTTIWLEPAAFLCWVEVKAGRWDSGLARMDRTIEIARASGQNYVLEKHVVASLSAAKAFVVARMGRLAEATALAAEAVAIARRIDLPETMMSTLSAQTLVLSWTGDHDRALRAGAEAASLARSRQDWTSIIARCAPGLAKIYAGDLDAGRASAQAACDEYEFVVRDETEILVVLEALAHAEASRGRAGTAAEWADRAERVRHPAHATNAAMADLIRAHSLTADDPARSAELALRAAGAFRSAGLRLEEGRAQLRAGLSLAGAGRAERALTELAASAALFDACGARDLHIQALRARDELNRRAHSSKA